MNNVLWNTWNILMLNRSRYFFIALILLMYIWLSAGRFHQKMNKAVGMIAMMMLLVFCNPILYDIAEKLDEAYEYNRIFWMIPITVIFSAAVTGILLQYKSLLTGILVAGYVFFAVWHPDSGLRMIRAENAYKVNQESVTIADIIMEDDRKEKLVVVPEELSLDIRSYEPAVRLLCGTRNAYQYYPEYKEDIDRIYYEMNINDKPDIKFVGEWVRMYDFVYVVWEKDKVASGEMEKYLYDIIGDTDHYVVYAVRHEELGE